MHLDSAEPNPARQRRRRNLQRGLRYTVGKKIVSGSKPCLERELSRLVLLKSGEKRRLESADVVFPRHPRRRMSKMRSERARAKMSWAEITSLACLCFDLDQEQSANWSRCGVGFGLDFIRIAFRLLSFLQHHAVTDRKPEFSGLSSPYLKNPGSRAHR